MKKSILTIVLVLCIVSAAQADVTFTFDDGGLKFADHDAEVSSYMTSKYGSNVKTNGVYVSSDDNFNKTLFISTYKNTSGDFDIMFDKAIDSASFDWFVFDATSGADFRYKAYDENGNLIDSLTEYCSTNSGGASGLREYKTPVAHLWFSNSGVHDIGIDNLTVSGGNVIPAPGAVLLSSIGVSIVGWLRRRKTL